jgi:hypothetical protein
VTKIPSSNTNTNPDRTPVAADVFTYCTKEKIDTWHVVMNHNAAGIVDRVQCKSCRSEHRYKVTAKVTSFATAVRKPVVRSSSGAAGSASGSKSPEMEASWFQQIKAWGEKPVKAFDPATHFKKGEVFNHSVFGKGVVQTRRENKIDVLFTNGLKTLPSKPTE